MTNYPSNWRGHNRVTTFKFGSSSHISGTTEDTVVNFCTHVGRFKLVAAIAMILCVFEGRSSIANFLYYICAPVDKISTDKARRAVPLQQQSFLCCYTMYTITVAASGHGHFAVCI